ncbi:YiiX family permuted papain-like enzyme [soil metagenome]
MKDSIIQNKHKRSSEKAGLIAFIGLLFIVGLYNLFSSFSPATNSTLQSGDIIFQSSQSAQCSAVRLATHSQYSHCGIIFVNTKGVYVCEAVQPVKITPFKEWIKHGKDSKYIVRRLKDAATVLTPEVLEKMKKASDQYIGKNYDIYFGWSDEKIYCSELVWKVYKQGAEIEVGKLQKLKDFDLSSKEVKEVMQERYGSHIPLEEEVISPQSIFESDMLITVEDTY